MDLPTDFYPELGEKGRQALDAWVEMGSGVDWNALPILAVVHGIEDPEQVMELLGVIRDPDQVPSED